MRWVKSGTDGAFSLPADPGSELTVAAPGYATRRNLKPGAASGSEFRLEPDPALATGLFHLDFEALRPGGNYTEAELRTDLRAVNGIGFADDARNPTEAGNRASIDPDMSVGGKGASLKVRFPKNMLKSAASGIDARIPLSGGKPVDFSRIRELYLSYWVRFSDNFDFGKCGGKLPSLGGDYDLDNGRWKGRIMWRAGGSIQFYPELLGRNDSFESDSDRFWGVSVSQGKSLCADRYTPYLGSPGWHNIELHYKFETPGKTDGVFEGWVDGVRGHKATNSERFGLWLPADPANGIRINYLLLSTFLGGSDTADYAMAEDTYAWFDEFKVAEHRIDEFGKFSGSIGLADGRPGRFRNRLFAVPEGNGRFRLGGHGDWKVYAHSGRLVAQGSGDRLDLSASPHGLYFVQADHGSARILR